MVGMRVDTREKPDASVDTSDVGNEMPGVRSDDVAAPVEAVDGEAESADGDEADDGDSAGAGADVGDDGVWVGDGSGGGGSGGDVDGTAAEEVEEEGGDEEKE